VLRPINLIFETVSPQGWPIWLLPHSPNSRSPNFLVVFDWLHEPALWRDRYENVRGDVAPNARALYETNFAHNKGFGFKDWQELWGREKGKKALLLSSGPSMADTKIEKKDGEFTIGFNRSSALGNLDYYYAMDRRGDPAWTVGDCPETTFIGSTTVSRYAVENTYKEMYWAEHYTALKPSKCAPAAMFISISLPDVMYVAYMLGAREIELYGCDFALAGKQDGLNFSDVQYYFNADLQTGLSVRPQTRPAPVTGLDGKRTLTTWDLTVQAACTTVMARMLTGSQVKVVNKTPRGILWDTWNDKEDEDVKSGGKSC